MKSKQQQSITYTRGVCWFIGSFLISCSNDAIVKLLGETQEAPALNSSLITFFRLFFGVVWLTIYGLYKPSLFHTQQRKMHAIRGTIFFAAITLWTYGVSEAPITTATLVSFSIPLFVLLLSPFFLGEKVTKKLLFYALVGFAGVFMILVPQGENPFDAQAIPFLLAALLFALLDMIDKHYATKGHIFPTIFYSTLCALCLAAPFAYLCWISPTWYQLSLLSLLGLGGNAIIYALLKAYRYASLVSLAPIRYLELLFSILASFLLFHEKPSYELWGGLLVIPAVLAIIYEQHRMPLVIPKEDSLSKK